MDAHFTFSVFIYLLAAVVIVPFAKRFGLGSILGYLLGGIIIGPSALNRVGEREEVAHFAEFGVVMMLFIIGLELRPALLWRLRGPILGLGGAQVLTTAAVFTGAALLCGRVWPEAMACGLILAMSSTAIVLQSLAEKGVLKARGGQASFSVLLFQDISVIPILTLMPMLANARNGRAATAESAAGPLSHLPGWAQMLATISAVVAVVFAGRFILPFAFRIIAKTKQREIFTASALLLVLGIAMLMGFVGLSPALGAFVAGVVLADSQYRHQLEADIEPFKGLLLGLFFITVGAAIDFSYVVSHPGLLASLTLGLIGLKLLVLLGLGLAFRLDWSASWLFAFALAQGGEFCFVLLSLAGQLGLLPAEVTKPLVATVAISMAFTPLLLLINERLVQPVFARCKDRRNAREEDEIDEHDNPVILAGFGRFGHMVGRLLRANGFGVTVLDNDPDQVDMLARFGLKAFYGDASRVDLLVAAGAERAKLFICAVDNEAKALEICELVQREFPHLKILARANSRQHAYELMRHGVEHVYRETTGTALELGEDALRVLGFRANQAHRAARIFKGYDDASARELVKFLDDEQTYVSVARQHVANLETVLRDDRRRFASRDDSAWEIDVPKNDQ